MKTAKSIDAYIKDFPPSVQKKLKEMRALISGLVPEAEEAIKYGMPTFVLKGNLVHFAAFKERLGFYPTPSGIVAFKKELAKYETSKGAIRFPLDQPLPLLLIKKIVKFRLRETDKQKRI